MSRSSYLANLIYNFWRYYTTGIPTLIIYVLVANLLSNRWSRRSL